MTGEETHREGLADSWLLEAKMSRSCTEKLQFLMASAVSRPFLIDFDPFSGLFDGFQA